MRPALTVTANLKTEQALDITSNPMVDRLAQLPNLGRPGRVSGTRELLVPGTRYVIPYRVRGERLEIIAVFQGRQRWPKRL
jgi:plasmid stabilization system protein ParE